MVANIQLNMEVIQNALIHNLDPKNETEGNQTLYEASLAGVRKDINQIIISDIPNRH